MQVPEDFKKKIAEFFRDASDWQNMPTWVAGVFIIKTSLGAQAGRVKPPGLAVELNRVDENGKQLRSRGLVIRSLTELAEYQRMCSDKTYQRAVMTRHGYGSMLTDQKILKTTKTLLETIQKLGLSVKGV